MLVPLVRPTARVEVLSHSFGCPGSGSMSRLRRRREKPRPGVMGVSQHSMREKKREYNLGNMRKEGAREACVCTTAKAACCSCNCAWSSGPGLFILFFAQSLSFHVFVRLPAWSWLPCLFDSISRLHDATRDSEPRCVNNPSLPRGLGLSEGGGRVG